MSGRPQNWTAMFGLSALNFFTAGVQTGFDPFFPAYLMHHGWREGMVQLTVSAGMVASLVCQIPAGLLVDYVGSKRLVCAACLVALGLSAVILTVTPSPTTVWTVQILRGFIVAVLAPAIAALTFAVYGYEVYNFGERLGQNARPVSLGSAVAALFLGGVGSLLSTRVILPLAALGALPALAALLLVRAPPADASVDLPVAERPASPWRVFFDLHFPIFAFCVFLFTFANTPLLSIALDALEARHRAVGWVTTWSIVILNLVVVLFAPSLGRAAKRWGRRPVLLLGFAALVLRSVLLATKPGAWTLVVIELLDGCSAAVMVMLIPLTAADLTRKTGFLNLAIGSFGFAAGVGALLSVLFVDLIGAPLAGLMLIPASVIAFLAVLLAVPETRPPSATFNAA